MDCRKSDESCDSFEEVGIVKKVGVGSWSLPILVGSRLEIPAITGRRVLPIQELESVQDFSAMLTAKNQDDQLRHDFTLVAGQE